MTQDVASSTSDLRAAIGEILVQELEIESDELTATAGFEDEYGADSLTLLAVVARFERELGIVIPSDHVGRMTSLDKVYEVVNEFSGTAPVV
ncbi:acyl carrier protein [Lentzea aerocolonigenes]|uniref:acyl carrier protein n=1 Tax=Lentzea aerocolonigenes TaxID=68170 RepID=UPI0004C443FF|nr:acyl carrier protein [Lentzea aerocolonigenes]MCP2248810.1 acyl carrier protein [Lentzea aerocolonigenes]